jgi:hypothetical protein
MRKRLTIVPLPQSLIAAVPAAHGQYQLPPAALQAIVDAPRAPAMSLSPKRNLAAMIATPALPSIVEVAQPELKLAGLRINPRTYSPSRFSFGTDLTLLDIRTQAEMKVSGLPMPLRLADSAWSPDQRYLAFTHVAYADKGGAEEVELWLVDVGTRVAKKLTKQPMSYVAGAGFSWLPDASGLLVNLKPALLGKAPLATGIPSGPSTQDSQQSGGARQLRTYPDLLRNEEDARLFEHYATVQLALVDLAGKTRMVGVPDLYIGARVAPNGQYILTQALQRPFSYVVPASGFARRVDVRDLSGKAVHLVANKPLEEGLPPGNAGMGRSPGRRRSGQAGRNPRHRLRAGGAVRRQAGRAGQAWLALQRHPVGPRRPRAAVRGLVQDARCQELAHRAGPAGHRAGTGVRLFGRRPLQQSGPAGDAA